MNTEITWVGHRSDDCFIFSSLAKIKTSISVYESQTIKNFVNLVESTERVTNLRASTSSQDIAKLLLNVQQDGYLLPYANYCLTAKSNILANDYRLSCWLEDKKNQRKLMWDCGVTVPIMYSLNDTFERGEWDKKIIIQPRFSSQGRGVFLCSACEISEKIKYLDSNDILISEWIEGLGFNLNAVISMGDIHLGSPSIQLIGLKDFGCMEDYQYCGNDYGLYNEIPNEMKKGVVKAALKIGSSLKKIGYRGFFGIDGIINTKTGVVTVLEINPRIQASTLALTTFEIENGVAPLAFHHLEAFGIQLAAKDMYRPEFPVQLNGANICLYQNRENKITIKKNYESLQTELKAYRVFDYPNINCSVSQGALLARLIGPSCIGFQGFHEVKIEENFINLVRKGFFDD